MDGMARQIGISKKTTWPTDELHLTGHEVVVGLQTQSRREHEKMRPNREVYIWTVSYGNTLSTKALGFSAHRRGITSNNSGIVAREAEIAEMHLLKIGGLENKKERGQ